MRYKYNSFAILVFLLAVAILCPSCVRNSDRREYEEIVTMPPLENQQGIKKDLEEHNHMMHKTSDTSSAASLLSWKTPRGWEEKEGSGMRLATFNGRGKKGTVECAIIPLKGRAGGLDANVALWMEQINVAVSDEDELKDFLSRQKIVKAEGGFSITVIDLTGLPQNESGVRPTMKLPEGHQVLSMIVAVAELKDETVFIKMVGSKEDVIQNRKKFLSLCRSLTLKE